MMISAQELNPKYTCLKRTDMEEATHSVKNSFTIPPNTLTKGALEKQKMLRMHYPEYLSHEIIKTYPPTLHIQQRG